MFRPKNHSWSLLRSLLGVVLVLLVACAEDTIPTFPIIEPMGCVGLQPDESAYSRAPGPVQIPDRTEPDPETEPSIPTPDASNDTDELPNSEPEPEPEPEDPCVASPGTCIGALPPEWALTDFQPVSCGYDATYGLDLFRGHTTVAVLLAAWCGFCQNQSIKLNQMRYEFALEGRDVQFVIINQSNAIDKQQNFVDKTAIPLLQDLPDINVWGLHNGSKDDFYIYNRAGELVTYLPMSGELSLNLSTTEGYDNVRNAIVAVDDASE